jgi:NAD(P)-dependent dehydrogenase (short-subunit alcohol dehydrogenase family)
MVLQLLSGDKNRKIMILIVGASRGVGQFLLNYYIENQEDVIGTYLSTEPNSHTANFYKLDITSSIEVEVFVKRNLSKLSNVTLVNCAGITYNSYAHKGEIDKWKSVIETNLIGTYQMIKSLLPIMRSQQYGRIINFASVVATKPTPGVSSYAASKSALWGLSKSISIENASLNITINNINLGYSELGMIELVPEEYKKSILAQIPAGIFCEPQDILNTVEYLRQTRYITGSSIDLSGGLI